MSSTHSFQSASQLSLPVDVSTALELHMRSPAHQNFEQKAQCDLNYYILGVEILLQIH